MKHLWLGAQGASGFATPTANRHITFLFGAAVEQNLAAESSFDPFPYLYLQQATFTLKLWDSYMSITAWKEERSVRTTKAALQAAGSCRHKPLPCAVTSIAVSALSSRAGKAFRLSQLYKQKMLDLPWMPSLRAQTPAWHGRDAEKEALGDLWKTAFLVLPDF